MGLKKLRMMQNNNKEEEQDTIHAKVKDDIIAMDASDKLST